MLRTLNFNGCSTLYANFLSQFSLFTGNVLLMMHKTFFKYLRELYLGPLKCKSVFFLFSVLLQNCHNFRPKDDLVRP